MIDLVEVALVDRANVFPSFDGRDLRIVGVRRQEALVSRNMRGTLCCTHRQLMLWVRQFRIRCREAGTRVGAILAKVFAVHGQLVRSTNNSGYIGWFIRWT